MVSNPRTIVREIIEHIGPRGVVAGGAIRDIVLKRQPKDYDVFIFDKADYKAITTERGVFDRVPTKMTLTEMPGPHGMKYEPQLFVYETELHGELIQLIWSKRYGEYRPAWIVSEEDDRPIMNGNIVVGKFPFTINMMYVDQRRKIEIDPRATKAREAKIITLNPMVDSAYQSRRATLAHLLRRAVYLADKLGYRLPSKTLDDIYSRYNVWDEELEEVVWTEAQGVGYYPPF